MVRKTRHLPNIVQNEFGLSDEAGDITIHLGGRGSTDATACKIEGMTLHENLYVNQVQGYVRTGADYLRDKKIDAVDFLKIDTEGMDLRVMKGFGQSLDCVKVMQFEYGIFNISSHDLLIDFCRYLSDRGFSVGKIYPRSVQFFEYDFLMENFYYSNYIAVRENEVDIIHALKAS